MRKEGSKKFISDYCKLLNDSTMKGKWIKNGGMKDISKERISRKYLENM